MNFSPSLPKEIDLDVLRRVLNIPESKLLMLGIAIGHPDTTDPINQLRSEREPLDGIVMWHGFGKGG